MPDYAPRLRAMIGSRRTVPFVTELEPLLDILVHAQDIARPLGRVWPMPVDAAMTAADRVWSMSAPFHARRRLAGYQLVATDTRWHIGSGQPVEGSMAALLLLLTGRPAALTQLSGTGAAELAPTVPAGAAPHHSWWQDNQRRDFLPPPGFTSQHDRAQGSQVMTYYSHRIDLPVP